jgi:Trk K+ transport system NAD-binding subunit
MDEYDSALTREEYLKLTDRQDTTFHARTISPHHETPLWERDDIQFPRLLAEIVATQDIDYTAISDSMDLSEDEINEIFERAHKAFEASKENLTKSKRD